MRKEGQAENLRKVGVGGVISCWPVGFAHHAPGSSSTCK